jgi:hypothetical protein
MRPAHGRASTTLQSTRKGMAPALGTCGAWHMVWSTTSGGGLADDEVLAAMTNNEQRTRWARWFGQRGTRMTWRQISPALSWWRGYGGRRGGLGVLWAGPACQGGGQGCTATPKGGRERLGAAAHQRGWFGGGAMMP